MRIFNGDIHFNNFGPKKTVTHSVTNFEKHTMGKFHTVENISVH
jgi:hypothetical protein